MRIDWHADGATNPDVRMLDRDPDPAEIDMVAVRRYRLNRVRELMAEHGVDGCLLFDPVNIRYASGSRNMQIFTARNPARYLFIPIEGPVILYEFAGCEHLSAGLETIDDVRPAITASFVAAGPEISGRERLWARETAAVVREHCGPGTTLGLERVNAGAALALAREGFRIVDAQQPLELARAIKSDEELKCVVASIRATERAVLRLRESLEPGISENELWSVLHQAVIAQGGDYVETRLLSSGHRTNPWFQESSEKVIGPNELVALDTDVVGCFGYYADFSRTFHSGPGRPTDGQRTLYRLAHEQVHHNMAVIGPGVGFAEYAERAWDIPDAYRARRYYVSAHGVGMTGEYPYLYHRRDYAQAGYDGCFERNMTVCVESYIGDEDGAEGVKLEQHCLVTDSGLVALSRFPFEDSLLEPLSGSAPAAVSAGPMTRPLDKDRGLDHFVRVLLGQAREEGRVGLIDVSILGREDVGERCRQAAAFGPRTVGVPLAVVHEAIEACRATAQSPPVRAIVEHSGTESAASLTRHVRDAVQIGSAEVDVVVGPGALRDGDERAALIDLRRIADPARDARREFSVVLAASLTDEQVVVAAYIASRVWAPTIATGDAPTELGTIARRIGLVRATAGSRPNLRASLGSLPSPELLRRSGVDRVALTDFGPSGSTGPTA